MPYSTKLTFPKNGQNKTPKNPCKHFTLAVLMNNVQEDELYGVITVNLGCSLQTDRLAFVDENNMPGIGAWLKRNKIATPLGYKQRSGFCQYELYNFHRIA